MVDWVLQVYGEINPVFPQVAFGHCAYHRLRKEHNDAGLSDVLHL